MEMKNKVAVITGAAGDIGLATARRFLENGARTMLLDIDEIALQKAAKEFSTPDIDHIATNVALAAAAERAAQHTLARFGKIDTLVVNAGVEQPHVSVTELAEDVFDRVIAVNLKGAFLTIKHFMPILQDGGSIIITSSIAALMGIPSYAAYSASKSSLIGLMRSVAMDGAARGIRCNTIHPGSVKSKMLDRSAREAAGADTSEWYKMAAGMAKLGRLIEPEEVADLIVFLSSDRSRMITGQCIAIDGGTTL